MTSVSVRSSAILGEMRFFDINTPLDLAVRSCNKSACVILITAKVYTYVSHVM